MKKRWYSAAGLLGALTVVGFLTGCASQVDVIDPSTNRGITTIDQIDIQDWGNAAAKMVDSLLASGVVDKKGDKPSVIMISRIKNKTSEHIDTELLTKKIRIALNRSGKVLTTTAVAAGGPEDEASMKARELRESDEFDKNTVQAKGTLQAPDFSLSGDIIELKTKAGNVKQAAFAFQLSLTDLKTGLAVWEEEHEIVKRGKKASVGW